MKTRMGKVRASLLLPLLVFGVVFAGPAGNQAYGDGFRLRMSERDFVGAGGVFTTVEDFLKWDDNFYHNRLGKGGPGLIKMFLSTGVLNDGARLRYACGVRLDRYRGLRRMSHSGSWAGFRAAYWQFPDQKFSVVIFTNNSLRPTMMASIVKLYLGDRFVDTTERGASNRPRQVSRPARSVDEAMTLTPGQLREYVGEYYSGELNTTYKLVLDNHNLVVRLAKTPQSILTPLSKDRFGVGIRRFEFIRDSQDKISGFLLQAGRVIQLQFERIR